MVGNPHGSDSSGQSHADEDENSMNASGRSESRKGHRLPCLWPVRSASMRIYTSGFIWSLLPVQQGRHRFLIKRQIPLRSEQLLSAAAVLFHRQECLCHWSGMTRPVLALRVERPCKKVCANLGISRPAAVLPVWRRFPASTICGSRSESIRCGRACLSCVFQPTSPCCDCVHRTACRFRGKPPGSIAA